MLIEHGLSSMPSCVLFTSDDPFLAKSAEVWAHTLFDLKFVGKYPRNQKTFPPEVLSARLSSSTVGSSGQGVAPRR